MPTKLNELPKTIIPKEPGLYWVSSKVIDPDRRFLCRLHFNHHDHRGTKISGPRQPWWLMKEIVNGAVWHERSEDQSIQEWEC